MMHRALVSFLSLALVAGCGGRSDLVTDLSTHEHADDVERVVLEGDALASELTTSPAHEAPVPFQRLGLMWDAAITARLEVSTSLDGQTWSEWKEVTVTHVEAEQISSFVGHLDVDSETAAQFYKLRSADPSLPNFVAVEFLQDAAMEDGEGSVEAEGELIEGDFTELSSPLSFGGVTVNPRSAWGAKAPNCRSSTVPQRFTIHHTVTPTNDTMTPESRLRQIQAFHMNSRGWCDIGYNFLMSRDGRLWEGRGAKTLGAHAGGDNGNNMGISVIGTYMTVGINAAQMTGISSLIRGMSQDFRITVSSTTVKGHRQVGTTATSCPGDTLFKQLPTIISNAKAAQVQPPPAPAPQPTGTAAVQGVVYRGTNTANRVAGATVKLAGRTVTTDASGVYKISNLAPGTYTITASKAGVGTGSVSRTLTNGTTIWGSVSLR
jgi:hypothetical protein